MTTIPENKFNDLLENAVTKFVQEKLELLLNEEIKNFMSVEQPEDATAETVTTRGHIKHVTDR